MSDYRHGPNGGFHGGRGGPGGPGGRGSYYGPPSDGGGPPPAARFPPRGPAMNAFPPHAQAGGMAMVPPMARPGVGGFPPRGGVPPMMRQPPPMAYAPPASATALPVGWSEHFTPQGLRYYYNASTGVSTYDLPSAIVTAAPATQNGSATPATAAPMVTWIEYKDDASGQKYYYNTITKATTWDQPEEFRMQQARVEVEKMKSSTEATGAVEAEEQKRKDQKRRVADEEAAKTFESMSKDDRINAFKTFLEEKQISPQFKWQEAQRFITKEGLDKDPRWKFALATVGEKKQAFSEYCTQIVNKQTIDRKRQAKRIREEFLELLGNVEDKIVRNHVSWEDLDQGAEFFGLRKDSRWLAIEDVKDKKSLFDGFLQDALRKKTQREAQIVDEFKVKYMATLRTKTQIQEERAAFAGKRRLDSDLKKKVWQYFDEMEDAASVRGAVTKSNIYDWAEEYLLVLKDEEAELAKIEREKKKQLEEAFTKKLDEVVDEWLAADKVDMNTSWKDIGESLSVECMSRFGESPSTSLSERRQRRAFERKIKQVREGVKGSLSDLQFYLEKAGFIVTGNTTYDAFCVALKQGIVNVMETSKPEEGEEAPTADAASKKPFQLELERLVQASTDSVAFPLAVKHAFQVLQYQAAQKFRVKNPLTAHRESSRSPSVTRKRRRSSVESPRRSRSPSPRRSRSRSRSVSSRSRRRSRSQSRDPRAVLVAPSYSDLPPATKRHHLASGSLTNGSSRAGPPAVVPVMDEAAKAEEIIRQARLKLQAKQATKPLGHDSEPEEGEEMEDGECEE